mmetsp:Transcript_32487/g.127403  ORF Transcript_32487/g.127403 Transcript_32487/m.127403 type:complete len:112 (+) Transcript_32487:1229-1564(+)
MSRTCSESRIRSSQVDPFTFSILRRYIYLWINYATWEELEMGDLDRARQVYRSCLKSIPDKHKWFSFSKVGQGSRVLRLDYNTCESTHAYERQTVESEVDFLCCFILHCEP